MMKGRQQIKPPSPGPLTPAERDFIRALAFALADQHYEQSLIQQTENQKQPAP